MLYQRHFQIKRFHRTLLIFCKVILCSSFIWIDKTCSHITRILPAVNLFSIICFLINKSNTSPNFSIFCTLNSMLVSFWSLSQIQNHISLEAVLLYLIEISKPLCDSSRSHNYENEVNYVSTRFSLLGMSLQKPALWYLTNV